MLTHVCSEEEFEHELSNPIHGLLKTKVNFLLLIVILLMKDNVFLKKVYILIFCIVYVLLMRYQRICWRVSREKMETPKFSWRRNFYVYDREKHWKDVILENNEDNKKVFALRLEVYMKEKRELIKRDFLCQLFI